MATPSEFISAYRERFPDDPRTDAELISVLGIDPTPRPGAPTQEDVTAFAPTPSVGRSARLGLESGIYGLGSTLASAGALAADWVPGTFADPVRNELLQTAREQEQRAGELSAQAPVTDISKVTSPSEFINWAAFGLGQVAPTMAETMATAAIGGLAGTAATAETGPGAVVGGMGGVILGAVERKAVKSLISKGARELTEDIIKSQFKNELRDEMKNIAARWGVRAAGGINSWALSSGELYGDLLKNGNISPDDARNYSTGLGAVAAIPDTFLPEYLWGRFFDRDVLVKPVSKEESREAGNFLLKFLLNTGEEAAKAGAVEGSTEAFQEWINVAADHWADPKSARSGFEISEEEWNRIKNAGAVGALAGASTAPATGFADTSREMRRPVAEEEAARGQLWTPPPPPAPWTPPAQPWTPPVPPEPVVAPEQPWTPPPPPPEQPWTPPVPPEPVVAPEQPWTPPPPPEQIVSTATDVEALLSSAIDNAEKIIAASKAQGIEPPAELTNLLERAKASTVVESKKIGAITEWHPLTEAPSIGTLKAYGTEVGINKSEAVGKPALTRMTIVTEDPATGAVSVNGVYGVSGAKDNVRVHTGGTTGRAVTAQMVAENLGLSVNTVQAAKRSDSKVSAETKTKVREAYAALGAANRQNQEIGDFVKDKNVLGFLKLSDPSEDFRTSYPSKEAFNGEVATLAKERIKVQESKVKAKEERKEGIAGERAMARLRMLGQKGASVATILDYLSEYVASTAGSTKEEALHGLLSTKFLNDPFVVDANHLSRAFAVFGERSIGHEGSLEAGKKLAGILSKADLEAALEAEPTSLPTHIEAAIAGTFGNNAGGVKNWAAKRADMGKRKLGRPVSEVSLDVEGTKEPSVGEVSEETPLPVSAEEGTISRAEEMETAFGFERPTPIDELDNASESPLMHTTDDELSLAYQAFDLTDGKLVNLRDENAVLDYVEEFRSKLQSLNRQKQFAKLGLFQNNKLTDDNYIRGLVQDILTKKVLRTRAVPSIYRVTPTFVKTAFNNLIDFLGSQGIDVRLLNGVVDSASEMLVNEQAKIAIDKNTGRTVVTLALNDLSKPTLHNLRALMHETAHAIVRGLPVWQQRAFHDTVWAAFNEGSLLRASNDPRLSSWTMAERAGLTKEEFLEELLVEHLTALGIDRAQSKSLIGDFFRFIRRIFTVAAERLMNSKGYTTESPDKMLSFVEREFTAVIDRATAPRTDILEFLGISRRGPESKTLYLSTSNGDTVAQIYNPATGELSSNKIVLDSPAAVQANVEQIVDQLFHIPNSEIATTVTDQSKFEAGIVDTIPGKKLLPNHWLVTVFNYGDGIPVAVQIDSIENGKNIFSASPEVLREQGYFVPDFKALPTGQYSVDEASKKVSVAKTEQRKILRDKFRVLRTLENGTNEVVSEHDTLRQARIAASKGLDLFTELDQIEGFDGSDPSPKLSADLENVAAGITDIVSRVTGGRSRLFFVKDLTIPVEYADKSTKDLQLQGMNAGDIIAMNTTAMAIESGNGDLLTTLSTASHESWHFLDANGFLSDEERTLLGKSRKELESVLTKLRGSEFDWSAMPEDELHAFAFQEYTRAVMAGRPGDFPNIDTRTVFDKVYQFFKELAKMLKGLGYNSVEDFTVKNIFYKAWTGEMASRIPQKSREVLFAAASEPKREGSPLVRERIKFDMEVLSATLNTLDSKIREIYAPVLRGMTLEDYFSKILRLPKSAIPTVEMKVKLNEQSELHGLSGLYRDTLSLDGTGDSAITNPVMRTQVQNEVYRALHKLEMKIRKAGISESVEIEKGIATNVKSKEDFLKRIGNYENSSTILNPLVAELIRLARHLRQDLMNGESKRPVTEAWRELLGYDADDKQFTAADLPAMTSAVGSLSSNDGQTLLTYVTEMAKLGLNYDENPSASRDKIKAANIVALNDLVDGSPVGSAKLAILTTLAKFDPALFGLARLRVEKNPSDKLGLAKLLNEALAGGNTKWSLLLSSKRELIGAPKYSKYVLHAVNLTRKKLISEFNSLVKRQGNKEQFEIAARALQKYKSSLESDAGFSLADGPILQGTEIFHVTDPNADRDTVLASRVPADITGEGARAGMVKIWMDNLQWLNAFTGPKDALYLAVKRQTEKLGTMLTDRTQRQGKKWWGTQFIQSISDRLLDTGSPTGRDLGRMLHRYSDLLFSNEENVQRYGRLFNNAYAAAAKSFGLLGNSEEFRQLFLNPAYSFIESRPDITDKNRLYVELKAYLMTSSPSAEKLLRSVPGGFDKLTACIEANSAAWSHLRKLADQWGVLVEDSALKVYNPLTGKEESILRPGISVATFMAPRSVRKVASVVETIRNLWSRDDSFGMKYIEDRYLGRDVFKNKAFQKTLAKLDDAGKRELIAKLQRFMASTPAGRAGVQAGLAAYFNDTVNGEFVLPLIKRAEGDVFRSPSGGYTSHSNVLKAWEECGGDILLFAENLFALENEPAETDTEAALTEKRAKYVASIVNTFLGYYKMVDSLSQSATSSKEYLGGDSVRHSLIDARRAQLMPQEWVDYAMATPEALHVSLTSLATHASMGRDMEDFNRGMSKVVSQLTDARDTLNRRRVAVRRAAELSGEVLSAKQVEKRVAASFSDQKEYALLRNLSEHISDVSEIPNQVGAWLHTQANPDADLRVPLAVTRGVAGMMVNTWRTFLYNANALLSPFMQYKMSKTAVNQFLNNLKYTKQEALGTLLSALGRQLNETASEREFRESVGMFIDPEVYTSMYGRWANPGAGGNYESDQTGRTVSRIRKTVDTVTNFGWGGNARYAKLRPFGALNMGSFWFKRAIMQGQLVSVTNLLNKAVSYMESRPEVVDDPSFRFSADMLGYTSKIGLDETAAFEGLVASVERSGYPLEVLAREALGRKRQGKEGALLTKTQSQAIMARALDELSLESSVSNTPIWTQTNSFARAAMPLLTWPLNQTNAVLKSFMTADGQTSLRAARNGAKAMLFAIVPMSLAYTLLMDDFDEEVLGRKGNLMPLSLDGGFGPFAGASVERLARMGTFGLAGDLVNGLRVYGADGDLRGLSFDQRVLFMNSTLTAMRLVSTLVQQGPSNLTYESFYRPLITSLGAGQAVQYSQLINKYGNDWLGVRPFTAEYEALNRLNVRYYLAGAGRLTGLEVRGLKGGGGTTNSVRPWVTRMGVAAMADDRSEFIEAYKNAVTEAKRLGEENPEEYVKRSYSYSHPLRSVFQTPPSKGQFVRLLNSMNETGRDGVLSAVHHYNLYGESLGLKPYTGTEEKEPKTGKQEANPLDVKRKARQALFNSEFFK